MVTPFYDMSAQLWAGIMKTPCLQFAHLMENKLFHVTVISRHIACFGFESINCVGYKIILIWWYLTVLKFHLFVLCFSCFDKNDHGELIDSLRLNQAKLHMQMDFIWRENICRGCFRAGCLGQYLGLKRKLGEPTEGWRKLLKLGVP